MLTRLIAAPLAAVLMLIVYAELAAAEPAPAPKERDREYFNGDVDERVFALSADDVARVHATIQRADIWNLPPEPGRKGEERITCSDGVGVFLEGVNDGSHHLIQRSCSWNSSFQLVVALFHELARTKEPEHGPLILD